MNMEPIDQREDQWPIVLEECTKVSSLGNLLRASEVQVDGITPVLNRASRLKESIRVICAELAG